MYELTYQLLQTSSDGGGVLSVSPHDIVGHLNLGFNQEVHFKHTGAKRFNGVDYRGTYKVFYGSSSKRGTLNNECNKPAILILEPRTYGAKSVWSCFSMKSINRFAENVHLRVNSYKIK